MMKNLVKYIAEYNQIENDIDVSDLFKSGGSTTQFYMIFYDIDKIVDVVGYDAEDDIIGDGENTTNNFTAKVWKLKPGEALSWGKNIWCRIR